MRIVLVANDTTFIYNLRREILKGLIAEGHEVSVMCQVLQFKEELEQMGCGVIDIETARQGKNPFKDIVLFRKYYQAFKRHKPDVMLGNNIKPNVYAGLACQMLKIKYIPNITGLGTPVENPGPLQALTPRLYKMGVAGAAIATDISQLVSCVLSLRFLMRVEDDYRVTAKEVRVHNKKAVRIIKVGLPTGIQNMVISLSNVLVQVSVNGYGAAAMAGFAAYMKVDGFNILPVLSFGMAATTFVGQNFGAGKIDRVKKGTFVTLGMCIVYTILTGILLLIFQDPIMHLFTGDETVIAYGKICMLYFCPFYWMLGILQGLAGTVRGTGKRVPPMVVLLISLCLFRIVWIQFALPLFAGIEGVLLVYPVSWAVGAVLMVLYASKGKWLQLPEAIS